MAYTVPTTDDFLARYPEFENEEEEVIQANLNEAALFVGQNWLSQAAYTAGILALAAHFQQTSAGGYDTGGLKSVSLGSISVTYADSSAVGSLETTSYGQRYLDLARANVLGPVVI